MAVSESTDLAVSDEPKDLSGLDDIEARLARYRRAGDVLAAATRYRRELRSEVLDALKGVSEGVTRDWRLRVVQRVQAEYTVPEAERSCLYVEPVDGNGDAANEPHGSE